MERRSIAALCATVGAVVGAALYRRYRRALDPISPKTFRPFRLLERHVLSCGVRLLVFEVPFGRALNLPTGKHVQLTFYDHGEQVLRSYTPIESTEPGRFTLLLKLYPGGRMGAHLEGLRIGDAILARGPTGRISYAPGVFTVGEKRVRCAHILMLAGGTGITPMLQIIQAVLRNARDATKLTLLFAASTPDDVLLMHEIVGLAMRHQAQFTLVLTVSTPTPAWHDSAQRAGPVAHESGRLTAEMVARHAPRCLGQRPFPDWCVAGYCGPPSFEACAKQILATLGYGENGLRVYRW